MVEFHGFWLSTHGIRESVDSPCRDGADAQYMQYLSKSRITSPQINMQKAYLSAQASSLSGSVISKTHIVAQKPLERQLNTKVCGSKSVIFGILSVFVTTFVPTTITQKRFKHSP